MGKDDLCSNTRWSTTQAIRVPSVTVLNLISLCHLLCLSVTAITAGSGTARKHTLQAALGCLQLVWDIPRDGNSTTSLIGPPLPRGSRFLSSSMKTRIPQPSSFIPKTPQGFRTWNLKPNARSFLPPNKHSC